MSWLHSFRQANISASAPHLLYADNNTYLQGCCKNDNKIIYVKHFITSKPLYKWWRRRWWFYRHTHKWQAPGADVIDCRKKHSWHWSLGAMWHSSSPAPFMFAQCVQCKVQTMLRHEWYDRRAWHQVSMHHHPQHHTCLQCAISA